MFLKKIRREIRKSLDGLWSALGKKADHELVEREVKRRWENYVDCFKCGNLVNRQKAKPLAVFEKDVFEKQAENGFLLNDYVLRMAMSTLNGEIRANQGDDRATTIYFCQHCEAKLPSECQKKTK